MSEICSFGFHKNSVQKKRKNCVHIIKTTMIQKKGRVNQCSVWLSKMWVHDFLIFFIFTNKWKATKQVKIEATCNKSYVISNIFSLRFLFQIIAHRCISAALLMLLFYRKSFLFLNHLQNLSLCSRVDIMCLCT